MATIEERYEDIKKRLFPHHDLFPMETMRLLDDLMAERQSLETLFPKDVLRDADYFKVYDMKGELLTGAKNLEDMSRRVFQIYEGTEAYFICEAQRDGKLWARGVDAYSDCPRGSSSVLEIEKSGVVMDLKHEAIAEIALSAAGGVAYRAGLMLALEETPNPKGEGVFVSISPRGKIIESSPALWLVIDEQGYALNAPAKGLTPTLPWPREAPAGVWERTGLDPYVATEALKIVYGE